MGAQSGFWAVQGGFSEARALVFFQLFSIGLLKRFWGVAMSALDFTHLSIHPSISFTHIDSLCILFRYDVIQNEKVKIQNTSFASDVAN